jgi:hypothetical protein
LTSLAESDRDRNFESFFRLELVPEYGFCKLPLNYGFDFVGMKAGETVIAEVKCRRNYDLIGIPDNAVLLSWHKHSQMLTYADQYAATPLFFVAAKDGLWGCDVRDYAKIEPLPRYRQPVLTFSSHYDKNSTADCHPCVLLPVEAFELVMTYDEMLTKRKNYDRKIQEVPNQTYPN